MELLDLPPELFQNVTHHLIELVGVRAAWELRVTCSTFSTAIQYEIMMKRPIAAFGSQDDMNFLENWADRYLEARLQLPLDVDKSLLAKIQKLIDWTVHELGINDYEECASVRQKICTAIKTSSRKYDFGLDIGRSEGDAQCHWRDWARAELDNYDKILGAIAVGSYEILHELFYTIGPKLSRPWFSVAPLTIALKDGNTALLDTIFKYLKSIPMDDPEAPTDRRRCTEASHHKFSFWTNNTVVDVMRHGNDEGFQSLLDFYEEYLPRPDRSTFDYWFRIASGAYHLSVRPEKHADYVQRLMDFAPGGKTMLARQHFSMICAGGDDDMIQEVLNRLGVDVDSGSILTLPIFVAVRSERAVAVNAVLTAGADPNITAPSNMRSLNKDRLAPIDVAIHRHLIPVIEALVQFGNVALPHISEWPTHSRTYNHLRNIVMEKTGAKLPVLSSFKRLSNAQRKAYKY